MHKGYSVACCQKKWLTRSSRRTRSTARYRDRVHCWSCPLSTVGPLLECPSLRSLYNWHKFLSLSLHCFQLRWCLAYASAWVMLLETSLGPVAPSKRSWMVWSNKIWILLLYKISLWAHVWPLPPFFDALGTKHTWRFWRVYTESWFKSSGFKPPVKEVS